MFYVEKVKDACVGFSNVLNIDVQDACCVHTATNERVNHHDIFSCDQLESLQQSRGSFCSEPRRSYGSFLNPHAEEFQSSFSSVYSNDDRFNRGSFSSVYSNDGRFNRGSFSSTSSDPPDIHRSSESTSEHDDACGIPSLSPNNKYCSYQSSFSDTSGPDTAEWIPPNWALNYHQKRTPAKIVMPKPQRIPPLLGIHVLLERHQDCHADCREVQEIIASSDFGRVCSEELAHLEEGARASIRSKVRQDFLIPDLIRRSK